ncbi:hypothetical protein C8Q70DRAFT_915675, partial [Cubamyces menziesii]
QILSITCDNASSNDTMTKHLSELLTDFNGDFSRTRCFLHILSLVAKSMLRQFDVKEVAEVDEVDGDVRALLQMAKEQSEEEQVEVIGEENSELDKLDGVVDDDDESWVDKVAELTLEEQEEFEREVRPVKMVLVKVRGCALG